ncbi:hypothetical protein [Acinetobacter sp. YH01024]|uniref:hypothetical protein n=1 Tax=Acinetobacter sp. YH01024 TaxID=2601037 RepID=UPI0015D2984F|nr:hypothetical protein [Acinetobacter sp. YH01024]
MDCDAICTETEESRLQREDKVRMQEIRRLFDLMDEREQQQKERDNELQEALEVLSWDHVASAIERCFAYIRPCIASEPKPRVDYIELHRQWLKAFRSAIKYLGKMLLVTDASLLIKLRTTGSRYTEISYPNLLVVIQPKLQTLNSIEA